MTVLHTRPTSGRRSPRRVLTLACGAAALAAGISGCGIFGSSGTGQATHDITVESPTLQEGESVPPRYTCEGKGVSPPLSWSGLPTETESLAVVVDDPEDAEGTSVHWVVFGLDPDTAKLPEATLPQSARQAKNSTGEAQYTPLCPTGDHPHEYRFTVYALDQKLQLPAGADLDEALEAIAAHTLARGRLVATSK